MRKMATCVLRACRLWIQALCAAWLGLAVLPAEAAETVVLEHGGRSRAALVTVPAGPPSPEGWPVVLVFHGGGGHPQAVRDQTGLDALAQSEGFLAVYPAGTGPFGSGVDDRFLTWNAGGCCGYAMKQQVDDMGFVETLLDALAARWPVDPQRIYATGHSNGGQISHRLACDLSWRIAAVAPNGAQAVAGACAPARPVPVLHVHGMLDPCTPVAGGHCGGCFAGFFARLGLPLLGGGDQTFACEPVPDQMAVIADRNGCAGPPLVEAPVPDVSCTRWTGCRAETMLCLVSGHGHAWPGGDTGAPFCRTDPEGRRCRLWRETTGPASPALDLNRFAWDFFQRHRLPEQPAGAETRRGAAPR